MKAINILWDSEPDENLDDLPTEIHIPDELLDAGDDRITDYLSDETGWCVLGWDGPVPDDYQARDIYDGVTGYGLYLNADETEQIVKACAEREDMANEIQVIADFLNAVVLADDSFFSGRRVKHLDGREHSEDKDRFATGLFFMADRQGTLFADPTEQKTYRSPAEMAGEFFYRLGDYLPKNFDYEGHLCQLLGAQER